MADSSIAVTEGIGKNVDTRTNASGDHRQVIVTGDPSVTDAVASVVSQDPGSGSSAYGAVVRLAGSATVVGLDGSTSRPFRMNSDGAIKVYDLAAGTVNISTINSTTPSLLADNATGVAASATADKLGVINHGYIFFNSNSTFERQRQIENGTNSNGTGIPATGILAQYDDSGPTSITENQFGNVRMSANRNVYTTIRDAAANERGLNINSNNAAMVDVGHTASIFTTSGSASGVSTSGNTIISPSASYNFKIFAFSVQTTAQVSLTCKFTNGSGSSPTEFFRPLITASGVTGAQGANLALTPPGYLFATGTNTTLSLVLDSASLVHYSISYIKESA